jgi:hypothetical protein
LILILKDKIKLRTKRVAEKVADESVNEDLHYELIWQVQLYAVLLPFRLGIIIVSQLP